MPKLSPEQKAANRFDRMLDDYRANGLTGYKRLVAGNFQRMIRAEAAAEPSGNVPAVVSGNLLWVYRSLGQCVCVTCGLVMRWDIGISGMHTGHFLSRKDSAVLFDERNVAPQERKCNYRYGGRPEEFGIWMRAVRGQDVIDELKALAQTTKQFAPEELVEINIDSLDRIKAAKEKMG